VAGFTHVLPEDAPGATVTPAEAQQIAERFLQAEQGIALGAYMHGVVPLGFPGQVVRVRGGASAYTVIRSLPVTPGTGL
jgi:hypothetical protein